MGFAYWVMGVLFACMAVAIYVDQRMAAPARPAAPRAVPQAEARPAVAAISAFAAVPALDAEDVARLLPGAAGWALVRQDGVLLATSMSRRAALLSAACVALRLEGDGDVGPHPRLRLARIDSPQGALFGAISAEDGLILTALVQGAPNADGLSAGMRQAMVAAIARLAPPGGRATGRHALRAEPSLPGPGD